MYSDESIKGSLVRGMAQELGVKISVDKFIGSTISSFIGKDGETITKTTIYFLCHKVGDGQRLPEQDENQDEPVWVNHHQTVFFLNNPKNTVDTFILNDEKIILKDINP